MMAHWTNVRNGFAGGRLRSLAAAVVATSSALLLVAAPAQAVPMNYGDYSGTTVDYLDITEDSQGLFGSPTVTGDTVSFATLDFEAQSSGAIPPQLVDGTVAMGIEAKPGYAITEFQISEAGAFSLVGVGTDATRVIVTVTAAINVLEVDGSAITPVLLADSFTLADFNLLADGMNIGTPWIGAATLDVAALALAEGITGDITKVQLVLDNTLVAMSEAGSTSFIDKKGINGMTITTPEPASFALLGAGLLLVGRRRAA